jgi:hypothetical protein
MKTISPAFAALRGAVQASKTDDVKTNLAALAPAFAQTEAVLDGLGHAGVAEARDANARLASLETALEAGDWEGVKMSADALNRTCQACHTAYRERQGDGTYRIRAR